MNLKHLWVEAKAQFATEKEKDSIKQKKASKHGSKGKTHHRSKILNIIVFNLFATTLCATLLYYILSHMNVLQDDFIEEQNSMNATYIIYVKDYLDAFITSRLKDVSYNIINSIEDSSFDYVQKNLAENKVPKELDDIFRANIVDQCFVPGLDPAINNVFICNNNGILADYSEVYASNEGEIRTWEYEISNHMNKELLSNTINLLLTQDSSKLLVEEREIDLSGNHSIYKIMTKDDLCNVFAKEGLNGIKNYTFLVPIYVMKNNDIFGVNDIINGQRIANNKFIIVQRYSLYDYIKVHHLDDQVNTTIHFEFNHLYFMFYLFIIIAVIMSILNMIYSITILNRVADDFLYDEQQKTKNCSSCNNTSNNKSASMPANAFGRRSIDQYTAQIVAMIEKERMEKLEQEIKNREKSSMTTDNSNTEDKE